MPQYVKRTNEYLTDAEAQRLSEILVQNLSPVNLGLYLCLHLGLDIEEICAIEVRNINLDAHTLTIDKVLIRDGDSKLHIDEMPARTIVMPKYVCSIISKAMPFYTSPEDYIITGAHSQLYDSRGIPYHLNMINRKFDVAKSLKTSILRSTFMRHCFANGIDLLTISDILHVKPVNMLNQYGEILRRDPSIMYDLTGYTTKKAEQDNAVPIVKIPHRQMNLLILGAGSHGHSVKETAEALGIFEKIDFLDDNQLIPSTVGVFDDYEKLLAEYPLAFVALGNNTLRLLWSERLDKAGFILPSLIHPEAGVSPSAVIGPSTIILPKATVNASARIGRSCIISSGAIVDYNAEVEEYCHVGCSAIVTKNSRVKMLTTIESGEVFGEGGNT